MFFRLLDQPLFVMIRFVSFIALSFIVMVACNSQAQAPPSEEDQIAAAVSAAPQKMRADATVIGYDQSMKLTTLRDGSGDLVCVADDPQDEKFHVACYHKSLAPFMERGRSLRKQGKSRTAVDSIRRAEIENGTLSYPENPVALYNLSGPADAFDAAADTIRTASRLRVLYVPYETAESTGLPTSPQGGPWLMEPGTPWAHVMIPQSD